MIVTFDPVAREVMLDLENSERGLILPDTRPLVGYRRESGTFSLNLDHRIEVAFMPAPKEPVRLTLLPTYTYRWQVRS